MRKTYVKICGITNTTDAKISQRLGAKFLGFIFYKKSPRYISSKRAKDIIRNLKPGVLPVGVFVNERLRAVRKIARTCGIYIVQLHGSESSAYCQALLRQGLKVIKALRIKNKNSLKLIARYKYKANAFLFDTYCKEAFGGTGRSFNWGLLKKDFIMPAFLSGGINPGNVGRAIKTVRPYAVDASSSLEKYPGKKDQVLLKRFFQSF